LSLPAPRHRRALLYFIVFERCSRKLPSLSAADKPETDYIAKAERNTESQEPHRFNTVEIDRTI